MTQRMQGAPTVVLGEDAQRLRGQDARAHNVSAARAVAGAVESTLGPRGLDKLLVDDLGEITVTNDGATVLSGLTVDDPAAAMVVEVAQSQETAAGDGTTTAVTVAGALLERAESLFEEGLHPTTVVRGFDEASELARDALDDLAVPVDAGTGDANPGDADPVLEHVAATAMTGTGADVDRAFLADLVVRAARRTAVTADDGSVTVDRDALDVRTEAGRPVGESELVGGAVVAEDPVHGTMPTAVDDASILLLDRDIKTVETDTEGTLVVNDPAMLRGFLQREDDQLRELVDDLLVHDPDVIFCQNGIEEEVHEYLADQGVLAVRRVARDEIEFLADLLDTRLVGDFDSITDDDLGRGAVTRDEAAGRFVVEGPGHGTTLFLRGASEQRVAELERAVDDALDVVAAVLADGRVLPGGGATEVELARRVRAGADSVDGRERLAVEAFAAALEHVPRVLARNAGLSAVDALVDLRAAHDRGEARAGLDVTTGGVVDAVEAGVVAPVSVERGAVGAAAEAARHVLRIDDIVAAGDLSTTGDPEERLPEGAL